MQSRCWFTAAFCLLNSTFDAILWLRRLHSGHNELNTVIASLSPGYDATQPCICSTNGKTKLFMFPIIVFSELCQTVIAVPKLCTLTLFLKFRLCITIERSVKRLSFYENRSSRAIFNRVSNDLASTALKRQLEQLSHYFDKDNI